MSCDARFANADDFQAVWGCEVNSDYESLINRQLDLSASQIHAAMAAVDACDCTLAGWAEKFLKHLNCVLAALTLQGPCPCPNLTTEEIRIYGEWINARLAEIRDGTIELCEGHTGKNYPAYGVAEIATTEFAARRILENYYMRTRNG
jgi:hypothetical protein